MIKYIPNHRQYTIDSETQQVFRSHGCKTPQRPLKRSFHKVKGKEFPNGYYYVTLLSVDRVINDETIDYPAGTPIALHRLISLTFIPKPSDKHVWVNHKDGNKLNNHPSNLEWTTISENIKHAFDTGLKSAKKGKDSPLYGRKSSLATKSKMSEKKKGVNHPKFKGYYFVNFKRYESANQAAKETGLVGKTIIARCKNPKFKLKGYYFVPA